MFSQYRLHHVGIVLPSLDAAEAHMAAFGFNEAYRGYVEQWHCWCVFTDPSVGSGAGLGSAPTAIELVVAEEGPLTRFNKGVGGVHHYAFEIDDFAAAARWCAEQDLRLLEPEPIKGAGNFLCNFIHPASTRGIQIELVMPLV